MSLKKDLFQNLNCNKSAKEKIEIWVKRVNKNFFLNEDLSESLIIINNISNKYFLILYNK